MVPIAVCEIQDDDHDDHDDQQDHPGFEGKRKNKRRDHSVDHPVVSHLVIGLDADTETGDRGDVQVAGYQGAEFRVIIDIKVGLHVYEMDAFPFGNFYRTLG